MNILLAIVPGIIEIPFREYIVSKAVNELQTLEDDEDRKGFDALNKFNQEYDNDEFQSWLDVLAADVKRNGYKLEIKQAVFDIESKEIPEETLHDIYTYIYSFKQRRIQYEEGNISILPNGVDTDMIPPEYKNNKYIIVMKGLKEIYPWTFEFLEIEAVQQLLIEAVDIAKEQLPYKAFQHKPDRDERYKLNKKITDNRIIINNLKHKSWIFRIYWYLFPSNKPELYEQAKELIESKEAIYSPNSSDDEPIVHPIDSNNQLDLKDEHIVQPLDSTDQSSVLDLNTPAFDWILSEEQVSEQEYSDIDQELLGLRQEMFDKHNIQSNQSAKPRG